MTDNVVNLRRARKAKARVAASADADANRAQHGRTKGERAAEATAKVDQAEARRSIRARVTRDVERAGLDEHLLLGGGGVLARDEARAVQPVEQVEAAPSTAASAIAHQ